MKKTGLITAVLIVLAFATIAMAKGPGSSGMGMGMPGDIDGDALFALDLSKAQTEKIREIREKQHKEIMPLRVKSFEKKAELKLLWMQLHPDVAKIKNMHKELNALKLKMGEKNIDFCLEVRNVLTPEQLSRYLALKNERGYGYHHGYGKGNGYGPMSGRQSLCPMPRGGARMNPSVP